MSDDDKDYLMSSSNNSDDNNEGDDDYIPPGSVKIKAAKHKGNIRTKSSHHVWKAYKYIVDGDVNGLLSLYDSFMELGGVNRIDDFRVDGDDNEKVLYRSLAHCAIEYQSLECLKILVEKFQCDINIQDSEGCTLVHTAILHANKNILKYLLKLDGINLELTDVHKRNAIHICMFNHNWPSVRILMAYHYETCLNIVNNKDEQGFTPIHWVIPMGEENVDDNDDNKEENKTPIHEVLNSALTIMQLGADLKVGDSGGNTVVHYAVGQNDSEIDAHVYLLKLFLFHGASANKSNNNLKYPIDFVDKNNHPIVEQLTFAAGKRQLRTRPKDYEVCWICYGSPCEFPSIKPETRCKTCNILVHAQCINISSNQSNKWQCDHCKYAQNKSSIKCKHCPNKGGIVKFYNNEYWAHIRCEQFAQFSKHKYENEICELCGKIGLCVQCFSKNCHRRWHVLCGRKLGYREEWAFNIEHQQNERREEIISYCVEHHFEENIDRFDVGIAFGRSKSELPSKGYFSQSIGFVKKLNIVDGYVDKREGRVVEKIMISNHKKNNTNSVHTFTKGIARKKIKLTN